MRVIIVTDAWHPQINGVVRTLTRVRDELSAMGHEIEVIHPGLFPNIPCPTYPEIRLALAPARRLRKLLNSALGGPDRTPGEPPRAIHIATEGPLGFAARRYCRKRDLPFTTSFHTRFPEYVQARIGVPPSWLYAVLRWFHRPSEGVLVATKTIENVLDRHGFINIKPWSRGVDTELFRPYDEPLFDLPRPIFVHVGRVAVEKNIGAFLDLDLPGSKVVVGDGPKLSELRRAHPDVLFTGAKTGVELARHYAAGDVFVFPSRTDTFGLVMLEALACGLPVAAFPVPGPLDVIDGIGVGVLDEDLAAAATRALEIPRQRCLDYALGFSWRRCAEQFLENLAPNA